MRGARPPLRLEQGLEPMTVRFQGREYLLPAEATP
jgi:hypothetical protein